MKKALIFACAIAISTSSFSSEEETHWGYSGKTGPENWALLSKDNFACSGKNQSPINLSGFIEAELSPISFNYQQGGYEIINNGHTVVLKFKPGSTIKNKGNTYNLLQLHFHAPSENHINGKSYPLEAHLVHSDSNGNLSVISVMFEQGKENAGLASAWESMPKNTGDKYTLDHTVSALDILPVNRDYYRFNGSLTTPPCSEGVRWFVMKHSVTASKAQIAEFKKALKETNNRPLQALNSRLILQ